MCPSEKLVNLDLCHNLVSMMAGSGHRSLGAVQLDEQEIFHVHYNWLNIF